MFGLFDDPRQQQPGIGTFLANNHGSLISLGSAMMAASQDPRLLAQLGPAYLYGAQMDQKRIEDQKKKTQELKARQLALEAVKGDPTLAALAQVDPETALKLTYQRNQPDLMEVAGRVFDKRTQQFLTEAPTKPREPMAVPPGHTIYDTTTKQEIYRAPAAPPDPVKAAEKNFKQESDLRGEFIQQTKTYRLVQDAYGRVLGALKDQKPGTPPSPASDIALVFGYMKMLDPESVVREGEYATAEKAAGVPERILNLYNKTVAGEFLSERQRQDMVSAATRLYQQARQQAMEVEQRYQGLAKQYELDPSRIGTLPPTMVPPTTSPGSPGSPGGVGAPSPGGYPKPSQEAITQLMRQPSEERMKQFDEVFGPGAATRVLRGL